LNVEIYTNDILKANSLNGLLKILENNLDKYILFFDNIIQTNEITQNKKSNDKNSILELINNIQYKFKSFIIEIDTIIKDNKKKIEQAQNKSTQAENINKLKIYKKQSFKKSKNIQTSEYSTNIDQSTIDIHKIKDYFFAIIDEQINTLNETNIQEKSIKIKDILKEFLEKIIDYQKAIQFILNQISNNIENPNIDKEKVIKSLENILNIKSHNKINQLLAEDETNQNAILNLEKIIDESINQSKDLLEKENNLKKSNKKDVLTISELINRNLKEVLNLDEKTINEEKLNEKSKDTEKLLEELLYIKNNHKLEYLEDIDNLINSLKEQQLTINKFIDNEKDIKDNDYNKIENFKVELADSIENITKLKSEKYDIDIIIDTQNELRDLFAKFNQLKKLKYNKEYKNDLINILNTLNKTNFKLNNIYQDELNLKKNNQKYIENLKLKINDNKQNIKDIKKQKMYLDDIIAINKEIEELFATKIFVSSQKIYKSLILSAIFKRFIFV
jgi:hypothetical protein